MEFKKKIISFLVAVCMASTLFISHEIKTMYIYQPEPITWFGTFKDLVGQGTKQSVIQGTIQVCLFVATLPISLAFNKAIKSFFGPSKDQQIKQNATLLHFEVIKEKEQALQYATQAIQLLTIQLQELEKNSIAKDSVQYKNIATQIIQMQTLQKELIQILGSLTRNAALQAFEHSKKKLEKSKKLMPLQQA
ncbi:hypothetical protein KC460_02275 [Candidatus Dependentiae bacterium]|nr:hypothetical protein [Candidatus Dependentiae bacterium]